MKRGNDGPNTYTACAIIKGKNNVSYPIQSGHGCSGCAEPNFWDKEPLYSTLPSITGIGASVTATDIGVGLGVLAVAGVTVHGIVTNVVKRKLIKNQMDDISLNKEDSNEVNKELNEKITNLERKIEEIRVDQLRYMGNQDPKPPTNTPE